MWFAMGRSVLAFEPRAKGRVANVAAELCCKAEYSMHVCVAGPFFRVEANSPNAEQRALTAGTNFESLSGQEKMGASALS